MDIQEIEKRLLVILDELAQQPSAATCYSKDSISYADHMKQLREYIELAGEYGIAYESIVSTLEACPFRLSSKAAVALLELGLIMKYKTERSEDRIFDGRNQPGNN